MPSINLLQRTHPELEEFELVPEGGGCWLWGYGTYGRTSVLAGQFKQQRLEYWHELEEALLDCPGVNHRVDGTINMRGRELASAGDVAPDWFDPTYAGERWDDEY
jgi:hypothetical protein